MVPKSIKSHVFASKLMYLFGQDSYKFIFSHHFSCTRQGSLTAICPRTCVSWNLHYIEVVKEFVDKKPHTMLHPGDRWRDAFRACGV